MNKNILMLVDYVQVADQFYNILHRHCNKVQVYICCSYSCFEYMIWYLTNHLWKFSCTVVILSFLITGSKLWRSLSWCDRHTGRSWGYSFNNKKRNFWDHRVQSKCWDSWKFAYGPTCHQICQARWSMLHPSR